MDYGTLLTGLDISAFAASIITLIEWNHGWARFYNVLAAMFHWHYKTIPNKPNSKTHQTKILVVWTCILCGAWALICGLSIYL